MPEAIVNLKSTDGSSREASADLTQYNKHQRVLRATGCIVVGVLAATGCLLVPGPHMLLFWVGPLVGVLVARRALATHAKVFDIKGSCPQCQEHIELHGGAVGAAPPVYPCPSCGDELAIAL
jgi:hypothetical protein